MRVFVLIVGGLCVLAAALLTMMLFFWIEREQREKNFQKTQAMRDMRWKRRDVPGKTVEMKPEEKPLQVVIEPEVVTESISNAD